MWLTLVVSLSLLGSVPLPVRGSETIVGRPTIVEGDTLIVRGKVVGLFGIAAPGIKQTCWDTTGRTYACGRIAAQVLSDCVGEGIVRCEPRDRDPHGRLIAVCYRGNEDLSAGMVARGFAVADRHRETAYIAVEKPAWAKRRGLWSGVFDDPTDREREIHKPENTVVDARPEGAEREPFATSARQR